MELHKTKRFLKPKSIICEGEDKVSEAESNFFLMIEEIEDYIDEFPINRTTISIEDIETCTEKISQLRTKFRMVIKNLTRVVSASKFDSLYSKEKEIKPCQLLKNTSSMLTNGKQPSEVWKVHQEQLKNQKN